MNATDTQTTTSQRTSSTSTNMRLTPLWARGTGIAILAVAFAYTVADGLAGPLFVTGTGEVTLANVLVFTVLGGTAGAMLAYLVRRFARRPRVTFISMTLVALAGYAVVPFTAAASLETAIWLNVFHLVVAIPVIGVLTRYLPKDRTSADA